MITFTKLRATMHTFDELHAIAVAQDATIDRNDGVDAHVARVLFDWIKVNATAEQQQSVTTAVCQALGLGPAPAASNETSQAVSPPGSPSTSTVRSR